MKIYQLIKNEHVIALIAITLFQVVFFHEQIFGLSHFWSGYWSDMVEFTSGFVQLNADAMSNGVIPFWNPYSYAGIPHLCDPSTGFFYPFNFIGYLIINLGISVFTFLNISTIFHFWLLQVGVYNLLRDYKLDTIPSLFGSVAFTFSSSMIATFMIPNFVYSFALLPWAVLFLNRLILKRDIQSAVMLGLVMAFIFLGGNPNILFFIVIFLIFYLAEWLFVSYKKGKWNNIKKSMLFLALGAFLAVLLCGAQLKEVLDFLPFSQRQEITYDFAKDGSLKWSQLATIVAPKVFGYYGEGATENMYWLTPGKFYHYWETAFYFGVATWILALIGFYNYRKRRILKTGIACSLFLVLYALGENGPFFEFLFDNVPGFNLYRIPSRALFIPVFIFSLASGFGLQKLISAVKWEKSIYLPVSISLVLYFVAWFFIRNYDGVPPASAPINDKFLLISLALLGLSVLSIMLIKFKQVQVGASLLVALVFIDLCVANKSYKNSDADPTVAFNLDKTSLAGLYPNLPSEVFRFGPKNLRYRYIHRNGGIHMKLFNTDGLYGIQKGLKLPKGLPYGELMAVKYYLADVQADGRFTGQYQIEPAAKVYDYARMLYDFEIVESATEDVTGFNFDNRVALESSFSGADQINKGVSVTNKIDITGYSLNKRVINIETDQPGILCLAEYYYPGWKVKVDNQSSELLKLNFSQQGVFIPKGAHQVVLAYHKPMTNFLIWIYFITLISALAYLLFQEPINNWVEKQLLKRQ